MLHRRGDEDAAMPYNRKRTGPAGPLASPLKDETMLTDSLIEHIENVVAHAEFADVFGNRRDASQARHLYEVKQRLPIPSTDAIAVRRRELQVLTHELGLLLDTLTGSQASPRRPSCQAYAKILALAAARIGANRVAELLGDWIQGKGVCVSSCVLLKGLLTDGKLRPVDGLCLDTLSSNGDELPRSLRLDPWEHRHEQFPARAMLSLEYETVPVLYDPEVVRGNPPFPAERPKPLNPALSDIIIDTWP